MPDVKILPRHLLRSATPPPTFSVTATDEHGQCIDTDIAGENALTIFLDKLEVVTLMTLGQHPEALALGYLLNQKLIDEDTEIRAVQVDWDVQACAVTTDQPARDLAIRLDKRTVTTGCGQGTMYGDMMEEIDSIRLDPDARLSSDTLYELLDTIRTRETVYKQAGAVHGCALTKGSEVIYFVEDVGRHNAVDAIAGLMWLDDAHGSDKVFYTTGRLTSEMVIKCAQMGVPILVSRSGLTQMGWEIAKKTGLTLIGRAKGKHYLLYSGEERFVRSTK